MAGATGGTGGTGVGGTTGGGVGTGVGATTGATADGAGAAGGVGGTTTVGGEAGAGSGVGAGTPGGADVGAGGDVGADATVGAEVGTTDAATVGTGDGTTVVSAVGVLAVTVAVGIAGPCPMTGIGAATTVAESTSSAGSVSATARGTNGWIGTEPTPAATTGGDTTSLAAGAGVAIKATTIDIAIQASEDAPNSIRFPMSPAKDSKNTDGRSLTGLTGTARADHSITRTWVRTFHVIGTHGASANASGDVRRSIAVSALGPPGVPGRRSDPTRRDQKWPAIHHTQLRLELARYGWGATMTDTEPVLDWAEDFEIFDDAFVNDPYPIWQDLREQGCPFARTERRQVSYMPTTFAAVRQVAADTENFSSFSVGVAPTPTTYDDDGNRLRSIISSDAPDHAPERRLMLPFFAPKAVEKYREHTQELCRRLIREFIEDGRADIAGRYAREIPPRIIALILGIDPDRADDFATWVQGALELGLQDEEIRQHYAAIIRNFFVEEIADRVENPGGDDLISFLLRAEIDGEPVPMPVVRGNVGLMLIAGIDTTWSSIGSALWHLATHPEDRKRLVEEPELIPTAVEEFLRAYSPVTMARIAAKDTMLGDREVKEGERILLSFPAANRDPEAFENPEEVIIDRQINRHVAFGSGIHRCAGSNLARLEMQVAIGEFLAMIPEFELEDPSAVTWAGGQVRGPRYLPVTFPTGPSL